MKKLIVTADDFGITNGVTKGIIEAISSGIVSRTSAMVCTGQDICLQDLPHELFGRIGLHLQLTDGIPISKAGLVPSLITSDGSFPDHWRHLNDPNPREILIEWENQLGRLRSYGIEPDHVDTHHNVHRFPKIFKAYCAFAKEHRLSTRPLSHNMAKRLRLLGLSDIDLCLESWEGKSQTIETFLSHVMGAFRSIGNSGCIEVMTHPGYADDDLAQRSRLLKERETELAVLCHEELPALLDARRIILHQHYFAPPHNAHL